MSALPPKADIGEGIAECPLLTQSGHWVTEAGLSPSDIEEGRIHIWFTVHDPSGHTITVNSSHASGLPV